MRHASIHQQPGPKPNSNPTWYPSLPPLPPHHTLSQSQALDQLEASLREARDENRRLMDTLTEALRSGTEGNDVLASIAEDHDLEDAKALRAELAAASVR